MYPVGINIVSFRLPSPQSTICMIYPDFIRLQDFFWEGGGGYQIGINFKSAVNCINFAVVQDNV